MNFTVLLGPAFGTVTVESTEPPFPLEMSPMSHAGAVNGSPQSPAISVPSRADVIFVTLTPATLPSTALTLVRIFTEPPGATVALLGWTSTLSLPVAGDAGSDSEEEEEGDEVSATADAPPAARMAAVPSPTKIGFTADRQITAAAPPSRRR
ncbi:hypothetical protein [Spirillospora sp. CA-128828]|uniref:hypothetical protein n=1 Tax=Spirillospora sp. CA-128828 TaxID=3240033 RepID=UPI003D915220